jgi:hypothetical protein
MSRPEPEETDEFSDEEREEFDRRATEVIEGENTISLEEWIENADE